VKKTYEKDVKGYCVCCEKLGKLVLPKDEKQSGKFKKHSAFFFYVCVVGAFEILSWLMLVRGCCNWKLLTAVRSFSNFFSVLDSAVPDTSSVCRGWKPSVSGAVV
jgi:hypothetical protein